MSIDGHSRARRRTARLAGVAILGLLAAAHANGKPVTVDELLSGSHQQD